MIRNLKVLSFVIATANYHLHLFLTLVSVRCCILFMISYLCIHTYAHHMYIYDIYDTQDSLKSNQLIMTQKYPSFLPSDAPSFLCCCTILLLYACMYDIIHMYIRLVWCVLALCCCCVLLSSGTATNMICDIICHAQTDICIQQSTCTCCCCITSTQQNPRVAGSCRYDEALDVG